MHHHAQDVTRAGKNSVGPEGVLKTQAFLLFIARVAHVLAHKLVDLVIGRVGKHVVAIVMHQKLIFLPLGEWNGLAEFPVSFTIELVSLDEDVSTAFRCLEKDQVGRDALFLVDFDDHAYFDVGRSDGHDAATASSLALEHCILRIVQVFVAAVPLEIVISLFEHRHHQYEGERCNVSEEEADLEEGDELTDGDEEEEHVEEEFEFVVEHFGQEGQHVVLLVVQPVRVE